MVQYDGLYVSCVASESGGDKYYSYIRFYEDGLVLDVVSSGTPRQVIKWLHRDAHNQSKGFFATYKDALFKEKIHFATTSQQGVVVYMGEITGDQLKLHSYSHINGYTASQEYKFKALRIPSPKPPDK
jgi:hypothetical protein